MTRERFVKLVQETLDSLPREFRTRIQNLAVLVKDRPRLARSARGTGKASQSRPLILGLFQGVPATQKSVFDFCPGPNHIILYQKNIEAVCSSTAGIRQEVRKTVLHELGHYFGMSESQLRDL